MEKKGDMLNQLAIISDLLENANIESKGTSVIFILDKKDFDGVYEKVTTKTKSVIPSEDLGTTFTAKIGKIEFVFTLNKNSV